MPDVICNTSPLQYLHQCGQLALLRLMYGTVTIPGAVAEEIEAGRKLKVSLPLIHSVPWLTVRPVPDIHSFPLTPDLGAGEIEVLMLAARTPDSVVVIDDALARRYAKLHGIRVTGTCGILVKAKQRGHLAAVAPILDRLDGLGFFLDRHTKDLVLNLAGEAQP